MLKVKATDQNTYRLTYATEQKGTVKVSIYDAEGRKLITDRISGLNAFSRNYDFSSLPEGEYLFKVEDDQSSREHLVMYSLPKEDVQMALKPAADQRYRLVVRSENVPPVRVYIYDRYNNLIQDDYIVSDASFSRVYDLSKLATKDVTFKVVANNSEAVFSSK